MEEYFDTKMLIKLSNILFKLNFEDDLVKNITRNLIEK